MHRHDGVEPELEEGPRPWFLRIPQGVYWTLLTVLVLVLVLNYDRRESQTAKDHVATAQNLEMQQRFPEALSEYEQAFTNPRLARRVKADVAMRMGDIYFDHYEDFDRATAYYFKARQLAPMVAEDPSAQKRIKIARERASNPQGMTTTESITRVTTGSASMIRRVELISPPLEDSQGPVVAHLRGDDIHAGEVSRVLRESPEFRKALAEEDTDRLYQLIDEELNRTLLYRAAVDAGYHRNPDISQALYDYQREMIGQRFLQDLKRQASVVPNSEVERYYNEHRKEFTTPGQVSIALIKTNSAEKAEEALKALRAGASFGDAATSYSIDQITAKSMGVLGYVSEWQPDVPGIGLAQGVLPKLMEIPAGQISKVVPLNGSYFIFRVINKIPRNERTLDQVRGEIEKQIRERDINATGSGVYVRLREQYNASVDRKGIGDLTRYVTSVIRKHDLATSDSRATSSTRITSGTEDLK